jgi:hypothetical protein
VRTASHIDHSGVVTLRHHGKLHHIGVGRTYARTHVLLLVQDLHIRVINAATGELLRELTLDPDKDYQPTGPPPGPPPGRPRPPRQRKDPNPDIGSGPFRCLETSHWWAVLDLNQ